MLPDSERTTQKIRPGSASFPAVPLRPTDSTQNDTLRALPGKLRDAKRLADFLERLRRRSEIGAIDSRHLPKAHELLEAGLVPLPA